MIRVARLGSMHYQLGACVRNTNACASAHCASAAIVSYEFDTCLKHNAAVGVL